MAFGYTSLRMSPELEAISIEILFKTFQCEEVKKTAKEIESGKGRAEEAN